MFIVTKKIDSENISKVCRTCLREDNDKMVCLFIGPAESSLGAKLQSLSCLKISQGDGLPEKMCDRCVIRAESALLFREQCRAADKALRQAVIQTANDSTIHNHSNIPTQRVYEPNQSFIPSKFTNYETYMNHQNLYTHNQLHSVLYDKEENVSHYSHIPESRNGCLNFNYTNINDHQIFIDKSPFIKSNNSDQIIKENYSHYRAPCMLQCLICNYTFSSRTQLINHSVIHCEDNVDTSSDDVNVEIEENSNTLEKNNYAKSTNNSIKISCFENITNNTKTSTGCHSEVNNVHFANTTNETPEHITVTTNSTETYQKTNLNNDKNTFKINLNNKFKCEICFRLFNKKSKLATHQLTHSEKKFFKCTCCEKSYSTKSKLTAHIRLHTQTNVYKCSICQKIFSYPSYLNEHMKTHCSKQTTEASFKCTQCNKRFHFAKSYKRHLKFHAGTEDLYHCDICDKLFNKKYSLKIHMKSHEENKVHKCEMCYKAFNQKSNLVEHMRIHTKIKPFKCQICGKSFVQSSHLKSHEISHNSVRRFQCNTCGKRFKLSSHLKRHSDLHSGLKMYKCDQCNQMFSQAFSLKRHAKKHTDSNG